MWSNRDTLVSTFPQETNASPGNRNVDIDGVPATIGSASGHAVRTNHVDPGFFETFEVLTLAGR
jgi:hypothetical protein